MAKLKQSKNREEILEREKENAIKEGVTTKERIKGNLTANLVTDLNFGDRHVGDISNLSNINKSCLQHRNNPDFLIPGFDWLILAIEAERSEKDKIISDLRNSSHASNQLQRDLDLQQAMVGKLQQQLVDEKIKAQNLLADSMAAQKRANQLDQARLEIEEFELKVKKLEKELSHRIEQHG